MNEIYNSLVKSYVENSTISMFFKLSVIHNSIKLKDAILKVREVTNIPVWYKSYIPFVIFRNDIYFIITNNELNIVCSHKYYDTDSIFMILNYIDLAYLDIKIYKDPLNDIPTFNMTLNSTSFMPYCKAESDEIYISKTEPIIEWFQQKNIDLDIQINVRKQLGYENRIGWYTDNFYLSHKDTGFIHRLKNIKNINEIPKWNPLMGPALNLNSYAKYKLPFFLDEMTGINSHILIPQLIITPKSNINGKCRFIYNQEAKIFLDYMKCDLRSLCDMNFFN
jgi:hypothetical protein